MAFTFLKTTVLKKTLSGVTASLQGEGAFHMHAERFWEHGCLHSR